MPQRSTYRKLATPIRTCGLRNQEKINVFSLGVSRKINASPSNFQWENQPILIEFGILLESINGNIYTIIIIGFLIFIDTGNSAMQTLFHIAHSYRLDLIKTILAIAHFKTTNDGY